MAYDECINTFQEDGVPLKVATRGFYSSYSKRFDSIVAIAVHDGADDDSD